MKNFIRLLLCVLTLTSACAGNLFAQSEERPPWIWIGPRIGLTGVAATPKHFNSVIQEIFPSDRKYFPLYTQIGLSVQQRIPLGQSDFHLTFQELISVAGFDQAMALPSISLLLGLRAPFGLEVGLGPDLSLKSKSGSAALAPAMIYAVGWIFSLGEISVPLTFTAIPIPPEGKSRFSLLTGMDFGLKPKSTKKDTPFNY